MSKYKNVYTILEKAKKGDLDDYYDRDSPYGGGLFGKLNFYKRPDLIRPHLHYLDETRLDRLVEDQINSQDIIKKEFALFSKTKAFTTGIPDDKKPNIDTFVQRFAQNYRAIPEHLKYDIFKMYYNRMEKLDFEERTDSNKTRYKFLEKANNPVGKIMTESSSLKSAIFTRNMIMYYLMQLTQMDFIDPNTAEDIRNGLSGDSEFNQDTQDSIDDMFNNATSKNQLERMLDDAQNACKSVDDFIDVETQEILFENPQMASEFTQAGKFDSEFIRTITAKLYRLKMSMGSFKDKIRKILDRSASYFSSKKDTTYEDLFNSDNVGGLEEYELLHPKLRKIYAEDITVKETKSIGKVNVYIDISGSMASPCGLIGEDGRPVSKMEFAKCLTVKMKEMDLLDQVYLFDASVKKYRNDLISISMIDGNGGTNIDRCLESINKIGKNSLIITDAEDNCSVYSEYAYFVGVQGADFSCFTKYAIKKYVENDQIIIFDGTKIYSVNTKGQAIK
jgi:hypothetical protein